MKIAACLKQVPNRDSKFSLTDDKRGYKEDYLDWDTNEFDKYALEEALRLKEKLTADVTVIGVGPERVSKTLRDGLSKGADRALHIDDPLLEGADVAVLARVVAKALEGGGHDLILLGVQSADEGSGVLGQLVAAHLGLAHASTVLKVTVDAAARTACVERELEGGSLAEVELPLPAVLTIQTGINQPRFASLKGILAAKKKEYKKVSLKDLGFGADTASRAASPTELVAMAPPEEHGHAQMITGSADESAAKLVGILREKNLVS